MPFIKSHVISIERSKGLWVGAKEKSSAKWIENMHIVEDFSLPHPRPRPSFVEMTWCLVGGQPHGIVARFALFLLCLLSVTASAQSPRKDILLNNNWRTVADDTNINAQNGFEQSNFSTTKWQLVNVPHNWDTYEGYRRLKHGNRHGYAWYRTTFNPGKSAGNKRYFLYFEGVSSFATVWLNGKQVGYHAGGRTTFTLDVTDDILLNKPNTLAVRADHPAFINSLPWICGGCSDDVGFSEGSQPMGIFRPVHLIETNPVRVQPFGVHIWNDTTVTEKSATLMMETDVKDYGDGSSVKVTSRLLDATGKTVKEADKTIDIKKGDLQTVKQEMHLTNVHLWSLKQPYLYKLVTQIWKGNQLLDETETPYGIRWISWPIGRGGSNKQFLLNGKPEFINGVAEYEHNMGQSHAFSSEQITTVVSQVKATGFNAFRDAHQPHNLEFQQYWDKDGILWWPQFSAHCWFDTPEFRANFKALLIDWVKERRNSPSNILWGLQNESKLPTAFAKECSDIIRSLDPTASSQRKITTCNGGTGTDWDVPQNWTGTYGGDPLTYATDIQKQVLVGEYGAWRSLDLHTEGPFVANGPLSENRMSQLMETKIKLAESVKDKIAGHFFWLLGSHENPGRIQGGEGFRELDRVGPINYKGLFTPWGEPTDAFYLYRANFASKDATPMVYIVSHTWPDRWLKPGKKDSICVYSNCDEVELFNDADGLSLGKKKNKGIGTHFQWDGVDIKYNVLKAVGYVGGKKVAEDMIVLNHLPKAPHLTSTKTGLLAPTKGYHYLYRYNCGGGEYNDSYGNTWLADRQSDKNEAGSASWTDNFKNMPAMYGSQRRTFNRVGGISDAELFRTFRYGRDQLKFNFPVPDGDCRVELFFTEPWYGAGGGLIANGWRLFDVAVNGQLKIKNLDIFKEAGFDRALKKTFNAHVVGGKLTISFPNVASEQAVISAIAISTSNPIVNVKPTDDELISNFRSPAGWVLKSWLDEGQHPYQKSNIEFSRLPPALYGAKWLQTTETASAVPAQFTLKKDADIYVAMDVNAAQRPDWLKDFEVSGLTVVTDANGGTKMNAYRRRYKSGETVQLGVNKGSQPYIVSILPVSRGLEPATDLRVTTSIKTDAAKITGEGVARDTLAGKKVLNFVKNNSSSIIFPVTPGVADLYALRIKYYNETNKTLSGKMQLLAADGTLMHEENLSFRPLAKGKSSTVATTTGTSINAGNYTLVITGQDAVGLVISGVEVQ